MNYYLLEKESLYQLARFVVEENYSHHSNYFPEMHEEEIMDICENELKYTDKKMFVAIDPSENIVGSIRVFKWNKIDLLPTQKLFDINLAHLLGKENIEVWHIGRFAIRKGVDNRGFQVFKTLMVCAINEVCKKHGSVAIAECDSKLLKVLRMLGMEAITLSKPIYYLGSETIPVLLTYDSLKKFLDKHIDLLPFFLDNNYCKLITDNLMV